MAVPLVSPWLRGTDGGWVHFTMCCAESNPAQRATISGLLGTHPAAVVPLAFSSIGDAGASAASTVVYAVSGLSYRLTRVASRAERIDEVGEPALTLWSVGSDVTSYTCRQRGPTRDPQRDCGTGTHQYTRGQVQTPTGNWASGFSVVLPIRYGIRSVDAKGRPLTVPWRTSTGHWTLTAEPRYHGWLWTTEWSVSGIASGRVAGSAFIRGGSEIVLTDGPFT